MSGISPYMKIARFDHWFKNVFVLPGTVIALMAAPRYLTARLWWEIPLALLAIGFVASSNYVLNEILDAKRDALHPVKKNRPIPSGLVNLRIAYIEWLLLGALGLGLSHTFGYMFLAATGALWVMGCVYNIPPLRTKDRPYLDVLSESINNPLRLLAGWYATGILALPPISLVTAYWMLGAFFMAIKRFAEYRKINDKDVARGYRQSFEHYNEERLLVSVVYYAVAFGLFFGIFLLRYKVELIASLPLIAGFMAWYIHLGFQEDSPTQYPEKLYQQKGFVIYTILCVVVMFALLTVDIPVIGHIFQPTVEFTR